MRKNYHFMALTLICVFLGVIIGVQYNTVKKQNSLTENQRLTELTATLKKVQEENKALQAHLEEKEKIIKDYESGLNYGATIGNLQNEVQQLRLFSGLTEVEGAGIVVTMNDSSTKKGGDSNAYLVHAEDILSVLNELNVAGAEAVSINGQRIVGISSVSCAGSIVMVNGERVAAPFEILAVGDGDIMQSALRFPGGVVDNLAPWGIEITIRKEARVVVPPYTQSVLWKAPVSDQEVVG
ncbi:DUF881 domain-containing protein [Anaerotignum sp. MB30-C6]|uniref:DUF881 domain-containing protein n=1 Tax=Anaerotignum sp. MB30-C6 TaxID=3070814 RepID=UPI0027DB602E|nr:DUF881 domain-containing protein [Anaerotignum sp. MB30-C6]WMI80280.1 DUF881 domain-containing protein [Anaerotignum sp. MB30-C6]